MPSVEINNFPTSFEVSNTVSVYDSNTEAINQKLTIAAAPNNDCIKVFQANNPTSITVNTISGFALETGGNLASIKTNTDRIKSDTTNADAIQVQVKNSSIPVSGNVTVNTISGFALESGGNLASIKTNTDRIKSDTTNTDAIQVQVKNSSIPVSGNVTVNTISGFAVESGGNLASIKSNTDRIKSDTTNTDAIQVQVKNSSIPVSGNVNVNTISGFAVESGGNLASIKTNTDKIKSDTTNTDAIQVQVKNSSIPVTGSFYQEIQPVSGTVAISNTGFDVNNFPASTNSHTQAYDPSGGGGYFDITSTSISASVSALDVAVKNTVPVTGSFYQETQPVSGDVSITNTSLDTHCYASSDGTTWHHLKSTNTGNLITESKTHDGSNVPITSTLNGAKQSLDVNVANTVAVNTISGFALETGGNLASIKTNTDKIKSDTTNTDAIQVQVKNSSIPVTGTITANISANQKVLANVYDKQDNGITSTNHTINKYGLDTTSALATTDMTNRYLLTSTSDGGSKRGLDVNIASGSVAITTPSAISVTGNFYQETQPVSFDTSSSIPVTGDITIVNDSTTNFDSATGINVYQILPKVKMYTIGGFDETSSVYRLFGLATPNGINTTVTNFGLANARVHYGGTSGGTNRDAYIDYVDSEGELVENAGPYTFNNTTYYTLPSMIAPIKFRLTTNLAAGQAVYISTTANSSVTAVAGQDQNQYCIGTFTVPNGYIGYISHLTSTVAAATNIQIVKWDVNGIRSVVYRFNNTGNADFSSGYEGSLGGIFYAGETVAFSNQTAVAGKSCFANMILKSIL